MTEYGGLVKRACYVFLNDYALAEDAAQDAFVKAYRSYDRLQAAPASNEKAWLIRVAINTCKDYKRSFWFRRVDRRITFEKAAERCASAADSSLSRDILALPLKYKEVILLYYYVGMKISEISSALSISSTSVHNRLKAARQKLRVVMEGGEGDE
jgi:RNA polymerase sigma-70 factor (ECF subfamily)